jgi:ABC-type Zn2+ transport system substrate-binding protein/surface adhesin
MDTNTQKKQTAVEWLQSELIRIKNLKRDDMDEVIARTFNQALQTEKEQIVEAFKHGELPELFVNLNAEEYYEQTYKNTQ